MPSAPSKIVKQDQLYKGHLYPTVDTRTKHVFSCETLLVFAGARE